MCKIYKKKRGSFAILYQVDALKILDKRKSL